MLEKMQAKKTFDINEGEGATVVFDAKQEEHKAVKTGKRGAREPRRRAAAKEKQVVHEPAAHVRARDASCAEDLVLQGRKPVPGKRVRGDVLGLDNAEQARARGEDR